MLWRTVSTQLDALAPALGIPMEPSRTLVRVLACEALRGPFYDGSRRLSAINGDGVPFQWSVSIGSRSGGLRFVADCAVPGTSISTRIRHTRAALAYLGATLPFGAALPAVDRALTCLLPGADLLDASLMGLCLAVEVARDGRVGLKVYVNGEVGDVAARYYRLADCLAALERWTALRRLGDVVRAVGTRVTPAFVALDVHPTGIGRVKLYMRPHDGTPALQIAAAEAAGCRDVASRLAVLHQVLLEGAAYPPQAVDFSVEFPADDGEVGFKVDLNTGVFLSSDAEVDRRVQRLCGALGVDGTEYEVVRDIVVGEPSRVRVAHLPFVGLAVRRDEQQLNVYFHPNP